ncbi:hypothetical protein DFQ27_006838 [Actinomortierella ambigua]|uniref:SPRY-domain-containing protein n=1 Tax=Actinomortierella ambigua TaxID=1343610 RepID=A0A9P6U0X6_9FUNG|nr:hypothetical protein DFQ27_006838 [Actinomortierella ambigua]
MDIETSTQSDSDSDHDSSLSQPFLRFSALLASSSGRNHTSTSAAQQYAQLQLRRAAHRPYLSTSGGSSSNSGGSGSRPTSRSSHITFGTLKKASMSSRPSSTHGTKAKLTVLPTYLRHTSFLDHFLPEGTPPPGSNLPSTGSSADHESTKRRRLADMPPYQQNVIQHDQHGLLRGVYHSQQRQHQQHVHQRRHHFRRSSDSSNSSSGGSSGSNGSGNESGYSRSSDHIVASGKATASLVEERSPLKYQLPSRWSCTDKLDQMELAEDDLQVKYVGEGEEDTDAAAIRANRPIPPQCGIYYFEVYIKNKGRHGYIGVGVCNSTVNLARLPGWDRDSWGYHGDDGHSFGGRGKGDPYGPTFTTGDTVGCGINFRDNTLFYTKNGVYLGIAFRDLRGTLYPTVGMRTPGEILETNFGQSEFMFNIVDHVKNERMESWRQMEESALRGPPIQLDYSLANLVLSYMVHHGYSESAKQFAQDLQLGVGAAPASSPDSSSPSSSSLETSKTKALVDGAIGTTATIFTSQAAEHLHMVEDTIKRKAIRHAILEGDVDGAIEMLQESYQGVLDTEEDLMLQLQCRKFMEMVRNASSHRRCHGNHSSIASSHGGRCLKIKEESNNDDDDAMDVDEPVTVPQHGHGKEKEKKQTHKDIKQKNKAKAIYRDEDEDLEADGPAAEELDMLAEAIEFGQTLQQQYKDDRRPIVQRMLVDAFSVLAYKDMEEEVVEGGATSTTGSSTTVTSKSSCKSRHANMLSREGVANAVNLAILASQQLPTVAPLETIYRQTKMTLEELTRRGVGSAAFFDFHKDCF